MSAPLRLVLLLALLLTAASAGAEPNAVPSSSSESHAPAAAAEHAAAVATEADAAPLASIAEPVAPPSRLFVMLRAGFATSAVALLLIGMLAGYRKLVGGAPRARRPAAALGRRRWWQRWMPVRAADTDRIEVLSRIHLGARESLGVVRIGRERLLIGVAPGRISMLMKLEVDSVPAVAAAPPETTAPPEPDFATTLAAVDGAVPRTAEDLRRALARSKERLERLSGRRVADTEPRD